MNQAVLLEIEGAVATVTLNRPDRMNAMNDTLLDGLLEALEQVASDPAVAVMILTGNGRAFCAGGDLTSMSAGLGELPRETAVSSLRRHARASEILRTMPVVTIAAVNGACAGAGLGLAAATDLRIASEKAVFRVAFLGAGMSGDFGTGWLLTELLGEAKTRELYLLDEKFGAEEAQRIGLVSHVHAPEELTKEVRVIADRIAASAPLARAGIKANLNEASTVSLSEAIRRESIRHITCGYSEDAAEAGKAFLEQRMPVFVGN